MASRLLFTAIMLHKTRLLAPAFLALLGACNEVETGTYGRVEFVPDECGTTWCDLDDGLAVDATTEIYLDGVDGRDVSDLHLEVAEPWIADVISVERGFSPRVTIIGNSPGYTDLLAVDDAGYVVDYVTIRVAAPDELQVNVTGADLRGPYLAEGTDDLYFAGWATRLTVDVTALEDGSPLMGKLDLWIGVSEGFADAIDPNDDAGSGHFDLYPPRGEHDLFIETPTAWRAIHFSVD
jgi:hypothetical protein